MGDGEEFVFRTLLVIAGILWAFATVFTTRLFVEALFDGKRTPQSMPFVLVLTGVGAIHVTSIGLYIAATFEPLNFWLGRVALFTIPTSKILLALEFIYLGIAIRRHVR